MNHCLLVGLLAWSRQSEVVSQILEKCFKKYRNVIANGNNHKPRLVIGSLRMKLNRDGRGRKAPFAGAVVRRNPSLVAIQVLLRSDATFIFAQTVPLNKTFGWLGTHVAAIYIRAFGGRKER